MNIQNPWEVAATMPDETLNSCASGLRKISSAKGGSFDELPEGIRRAAENTIVLWYCKAVSNAE